MAEVINLNKRRKEKARADKEAQAAENRTKFGRTKEEKELERKQADLFKRKHDAHKRDDENSEEE